MNDQHIDKLLTEHFSPPSLDEKLQQAWLTESSAALQQSTQQRLWKRRLSYAAMLMLVFVLSFTSGRLSKQPPPMIVDANTVQVPRDTVAWLEAGRLFTQLNMDQRARFAYEQAGTLVRSTPKPPPMALSQDTTKLANLLAQTESQQSRPDSTIKTTNNHPLLANTMGD